MLPTFPIQNSFIPCHYSIYNLGVFKRLQHAGAYSFGYFLHSNEPFVVPRTFSFVHSNEPFSSDLQILHSNEPFSPKFSKSLRFSQLQPFISQCSTSNCKQHNFYSERFSAEVFSIFYFQVS